MLNTPRALVMQRTALFSSCMTYRYRLGRRWGPGPLVAFVLLNPSTADEQREDPTVRRCIGFAQRVGFGGLELVNLYAYRVTQPEDLRRAGYPVGPGNDLHIEAAVRECERVLVAWGSHAQRQSRPQDVLALLRQLNIEPYCLRLTRSGHPEHPLRLPHNCTLQVVGNALWTHP